MLKPEDVDELKELQQSIKKSLDLFQQCVMFPPEDLHPGMYETMNHWLDTIGRDVFNLYLTLAKFQEFPLLKEQAELVIKKAEEYGYTVPCFGCDMPCLREQMIVFLNRAATK
jgi:ssDNA-specific exonuclease RecJ